jgi:hypothetical protein
MRICYDFLFPSNVPTSERSIEIYVMASTQPSIEPGG